MTHHIKLIGWLALCGLLTSASVVRAAKPAPQPLNVLFIIADDLRPELGCYEGGRAVTPNLDRLAATGVRFDNAFCQFPLCNPSRSSLLTGRYPNATGVIDSVHWFKGLHPELISMPEYFRQRGYATLRAGKIFHGGLDDAEAWTVGGDPRSFAGVKRPDKVKRAGQSDYLQLVEGDGAELQDAKTAASAIDLLTNHHDQPFFLAVGFISTHSPPTAPRRDAANYPVDELKLPADFTATPTLPAGFPPSALPPNVDLFVNRPATAEAARETIAAYLGAATFIDRQVGRLLDKLNELQLSDRTVVVFCSDHGYHLGEKGKWSKHGSLFDAALRVPLLIRLPGAAGNGQACTRPVGLIDLFPTVAAATGGEPPPHADGRQLGPLLREPGAAWDYPVFSMVAEAGHPMGQSIRTERWRLAKWNEGPTSSFLIDVLSDPEGRVNLAAEVENARIVDALEVQRRKHSRRPVSKQNDSETTAER